MIATGLYIHTIEKDDFASIDFKLFSLLALLDIIWVMLL